MVDSEYPQVLRTFRVIPLITVIQKQRFREKTICNKVKSCKFVFSSSNHNKEGGIESGEGSS